MTATSPSIGRRSLLALAASSFTGGCLRQYGSVVTRDDHTQLSVTVKTLPADADERATRVARRLAAALQRVGVDASVVPMSREHLRRSVLLNHDFDLYVGRLPLPADPDWLRPLLHSRFATAQGWANPFGYGALELDERLTAQARQSGQHRRETVAAVQRRVVRDQPFTVLAVPDAVRATRRDRVRWRGDRLHSVAGYLAAEPAGPAASETPESTNASAASTRGDRTTTADETPTSTPATDPTTLRVATTDSRVTKNLNPLSVPFRRGRVLLHLVYDSLGRRLDGTVRPWLAESWSVERDDGTTVKVRLREDLTWHDGASLTAGDVAFTYRFLRDTALGRTEEPVTSPAYRARISLVDGVEAVDDRTVRLDLGDAGAPAATTALTVPVLPEHVWRAAARPAEVAGIERGPTTDALVRNNLEPVGSGPLRVTDTALKASVDLAANPDHFLTRTPVDDHLRPFVGGVSFDRLRVVVVPSDGAAVDLAADGRLDATATPLGADAVRDVAATDALDVRLTGGSWVYHVGYNLRRPPFTNPHFRRTVARLLDREHLVESVFGGYATPAVTPLATTDFEPADLAWTEGGARLPFVGDDGSLDVERARDLFREAGYSYAEDGRLVVQR
ncbi:ABC transporter substrate-binding protein [Salinirubrum litoreum]|uniref:ABC transporter substrate-binding protein n=1 Tax=Salinirubrum litoreum TaxID=1126234 RepID=A0ABD5RCR8_9EURY|nr:ABC transporter substrate-binding protein [Salinirubrum litoreum]